MDLTVSRGMVGSPYAKKDDEKQDKDSKSDDKKKSNDPNDHSESESDGSGDNSDSNTAPSGEARDDYESESTEVFSTEEPAEPFDDSAPSRDDSASKQR